MYLITSIGKKLRLINFYSSKEQKKNHLIVSKEVGDKPYTSAESSATNEA